MTHHRTPGWRRTYKTSTISIHKWGRSRWTVWVEDVAIHTAFSAAHQHTTTTTIVGRRASCTFVGFTKSGNVRLSTERLSPPCSRVVLRWVFLFERVRHVERTIVACWFFRGSFMNVLDTSTSRFSVLVNEADNARRVRGFSIWERTFFSFRCLCAERTVSDVLSAPCDRDFVCPHRLRDVTDFVVAFTNTLVFTRDNTPRSCRPTQWRVTFLDWSCAHIGRITRIIAVGSAPREMINDLPSNTFSRRTCRKITIKTKWIIYQYGSDQRLEAMIGC